MKTASVAAIKARLNAYLDASASEPVVVTRDGKAIAVLLGVHSDDELNRLLSPKPRKLSDILDAADRRIDAGGGIPHDEFWRRVKERHAGNGKPRVKKRTRK